MVKLFISVYTDIRWSINVAVQRVCNENVISILSFAVNKDLCSNAQQGTNFREMVF